MAPRSRKRQIETIDLTGDQDVDQAVTPPSAKTPRLANHASASQRGRQVVHVISDESENELDSEAIGLSQNYNDSAYTFQLYGTVIGKIVGCRYYSGYATMGESVLIQREPQNKYDSNAIQVLNVSREQIGHLPRDLASRLAKYLDERSLHVEGLITGPKGYYECPIALKLYGSSDPVERVELQNRMRADRLPLSHSREVERTERERLRALQESLSNEATRSSQQWPSGPTQYMSSSQETAPVAPTMNNIIGESEKFNPRNAEQMVEKFGNAEKDLENMPMASQPEGLKTTLLPYQRQGLKWLLDKERPQLPRSSTDVVQLWTRSSYQKDAYTNLATCFTQKNAPELASGGILADDMGLGKTVQMIALMMAGRKEDDKKKGVFQPTLILAPLSVMSNWSNQIKHHVKEEHQPRVIIYHGPNRVSLNAKSIKDYDVVITTYETVSSEYWSLKPQKVPSKQGVFAIEWHRVILDEGHNIRNPAAKRSVAASNLIAQSRWILTGTPIVNNLKDLYSLVKFLRLSGGLTNFELFNRSIIRSVNHGDETGNFILQALMRDICLRRKKDMSFVDLRLPELSEYVHRITFLPHEKEKYDLLAAEAKGSLNDYRNQSNSGPDAAKAYRHLLEILLRLRQVCNHWKLCGENRFSSIMSTLEKQGSIDLTPENREALQHMLQISIESQDDCSVCLDNLKDPVITCCAHAFCFTCIERVIEVQHKCPLCRADLPSAPASLVRPAKELSPQEEEEQLLDTDRTSSKLEALLTILKASNPHLSNGNSINSSQSSQSSQERNKTVVFSQWTSFLNIVQHQLDNAGIKYARIDGSMPAADRDAAMQKLENEEDCTVLLASLGVCSVGLNLVAANQVILADTWWAPAIEDQAVDRVHRLGQKRPTRVFRLVMEDSIEENVLRIQEDKRKLMSLALSDKEGVKDGRGARGRGARLGDIERLLSGIPESAAAPDTTD